MGGIKRAGRGSEVEWRVPILISYAYWTKKVEAALKPYEGRYRLLLDSGAFTAFKQGKHVNLDEYCAFVKDPPVPIERYFTLDVIGDPKATRRNLDTMLKRGLNPIPVFTRGEDGKSLEAFYEVSDLVAIGGVAGTPGAASYVKWFEEEIRNDRPVHWLGFWDHDMGLYYKPRSSDGTGWMRARRWGCGRLYVGRGRFVDLDRRRTGGWRKDGTVRIALQSMGYSLAEIMQEAAHTGVKSAMGDIETRSWIRYSRDLARLGVLLYLVVPSHEFVEHIFQMMEKEEL